MGLFDKLESKLEQGVNGAFARAFKAEVQPVEIASGIRRAMDDRASSVKKGQRPVVPNLFTIELSPTDYERLSDWGQELDDELIASAQEHCDEQRYMPGGPLTIVLSEERDLETGVFRLRPATAKAADALAHSRNNPRPQVRDGAPARTNARGAAESNEQNLNSVDARPSTTHERGLGARIKGYLAGESAVSAANAQHAHAQDEYLGEHEHHTHDHHEDAHGDTAVADDERRYAETHTSHSDNDGAWTPSESDDNWPEEHEADDGFDHYAGTPATSAAQSRAPQPSSPETSHAHAAPMPSARTQRPADSARPVQIREEEARPVRDSTASFAPVPEPARPRTPSPRQRPWLKIDGQRYPLLGAITTLGRDDDADIVIDDPGVSRQHCEIRITHDGPHVVMSARDLHSTNGTFVNGDQIESQHVHDGDRLTVGRTHMTIHRGDRT